MGKKSGVYMIQLLSDPSKIYVGSSFDLIGRFRNHLWLMRNNKHKNTLLQRSFNKYGELDFVFDIIEEGDYLSKNHLLAREQIWISRFAYKGAELPYFNIVPIAGSKKGVKISKEHQQALLKAITGRKHTQETKDKISLANTGRKQSDEHKRKTSIASTGRKQSEEANQKRREKILGTKKSEEECAAISIRMKNLPHDEYMRRAEKRKGYKHSAEIRAKISKAVKGIKQPKLMKAVVQLTKSGDFIAEYASIIEASMSTGVNNRNISSCCQKKYGRKTAGGFIWEYKSNYDKK